MAGATVAGIRRKEGERPVMTEENLPIFVGIGEICEQVPMDLESAHSVVDLGAIAGEEACKDIGSDAFSPKDIDAIVAMRPFTEYALQYKHPFGSVKNLPRAIGRRLGCDPVHAVYSEPCGASPQIMIAEFLGRIASGESETVLVVGSEVIGNSKAATRANVFPDWVDDTDGQLDDRGIARVGVYYTQQERQNLYMSGILLYGLLENAGGTT